MRAALGRRRTRWSHLGRSLALATLAAFSHACGEDGATAPPMPRVVPLLDHSSWRRYDPALDPLAAHQPPVLTCPESAALVELASYEVDTTRCNYALSEHPSLTAAPAGADVHVTLLHYDLFAPTPAEAHIGLIFGDTLQWDTTLPIPTPGDVVEAQFRTTRALAAGDPIRLHLHNHGGNTYLLVTLEATLFD